MDYGEALGYLLGLPDLERGTGTSEWREDALLARPKALLDALENPQTKFRTVLVAGTKGKGSTAAMLGSILQASGLRVGLYSSPHLHTMRERIRINGELMSEETFANSVGRIRPWVERVKEEHPDLGSLSTFEVMTALAMDFFASERVDLAVLEVGLGGRLDATNVADADLALITPISYDHAAVLGNTLRKIANEKAGIIKEGKMVLCAPQPPEALEVVESRALEKGAVLGIGERDWIWLGGHQDFMVAGVPRPGLWSSYWRYQDLAIPLLGPHQFVNAGLAVAAAHTVWENSSFAHTRKAETRERQAEIRGPEIAEHAIRRGLENTRWPGRMEILQEGSAAQPWIVTDGAHNGESAEKLFEALQFHLKFQALYMIVGVLGDKELSAIARPFLGMTEFVWTVKPKHPRGRSAESAAWELNAMGMHATAADTVKEAIVLARGRAGKGDLILIMGSLAMAAQAREAIGLAEERDAVL